VGRSVLIIPVRVGNDPYGFIGNYQALQGAGKENPELAAEVADLLAEHPLTADRMAPATVETFARSYSFESARAHLQRLIKIPSSAWTSELAKIVRRALVDNDQLSNANAPPASPGGQWAPVAQIIEEHFRGIGL